jgi:hypothetical protein
VNIAVIVDNTRGHVVCHCPVESILVDASWRPGYGTRRIIGGRDPSCSLGNPDETLVDGELVQLWKDLRDAADQFVLTLKVVRFMLERLILIGL